MRTLKSARTRRRPSFRGNTPRRRGREANADRRGLLVTLLGKTYTYR